MIPHTIYVQGSYNDIHDCENVYLNCEKGEVHLDKSPRLIREEPTQTTPAGLPEELCTEQAQTLFAKLREAGMVDEQKQPLNLSNTEKGILAFQLAVRLDIHNHWQVFSTLWETTPGALRSAYNRANEQRKTILFIEKLKNILS